MTTRQQLIEEQLRIDQLLKSYLLDMAKQIDDPTEDFYNTYSGLVRTLNEYNYINYLDDYIMAADLWQSCKDRPENLKVIRQRLTGQIIDIV